MNGIVSAGQQAGEQAAALDSGGGYRRGRRRGMVAVTALVVVAVTTGLVAAGLAGVFGGATSLGAVSGAYRTSTATVTRRTLVSQMQVNGPGDAGLCHPRRPGPPVQAGTTSVPQRLTR